MNNIVKNNIVNYQLSLIKENIHCVKNYPKQGILFRDISPLLENHKAYSTSISLLANYYQNYKLTKIVGIESRGFLFGAPLALILNLGFIPIRKAGKLPRDTISESYMLEYGVSYLEIHNDAVYPGDRILIVDDILATGGTITASVNLIRRLGGEVQDAAFLVDLDYLGGKKVLDNIGIRSYSLVVFSEC